MSDPVPDAVVMTEDERRVFMRRRRARNWAILIALLALVTLFYFLTMARMRVPHP